MSLNKEENGIEFTPLKCVIHLKLAKHVFIVYLDKVREFLKNKEKHYSLYNSKEHNFYMIVMSGFFF